MKLSNFDEFARERKRELAEALGMLEVMRNTMPIHRYISHLREILDEMRDLDNRDVIRIDHLRLMKSRELLK